MGLVSSYLGDALVRVLLALFYSKSELREEYEKRLTDLSDEAHAFLVKDLLFNEHPLIGHPLDFVPEADITRAVNYFSTHGDLESAAQISIFSGKLDGIEGVIEQIDDATKKVVLLVELGDKVFEYEGGPTETTDDLYFGAVKLSGTDGIVRESIDKIADPEKRTNAHLKATESILMKVRDYGPPKTKDCQQTYEHNRPIFWAIKAAGDHYRKAGEDEKAKELYKAAFDVNPINPFLVQHVAIGEMYEFLGNGREAALNYWHYVRYSAIGDALKVVIAKGGLLFRHLDAIEETVRSYRRMAA